MRYVIMFLAVLVVAGAMFGTLHWFFRRLRVIEEASWGPQPRVRLRDRIRDARRQILARLRSGRTGAAG